MARTRSRPGNPEKNADMDRLELWRRRVARAVEIRTAWEREYRVEEGERLFLGIGHPDGQRLKFNHFAATLKTSRPNLFFSAPKFYVRPRAGLTPPVAEHRAAVGEGVLEAIARQDDNLEQAGLLAVLQAYFRIGVLKVLYDPRMERNPVAGRPVMATDPDGGPVMDDDGVPQIMKNPLTNEHLVEPDEVMTDEVYRWAWVDAANMLLPDDGPDPLKWTWIGEEVVVPLAEAKEDQRFPSSVRERLVANQRHRMATTQRDGVDRRAARTTGGEDYFKYYECYDLRAKTWYLWADGQDQDGFLVEGPLPAWLDNDPYAVLRLGEPILGPVPLPWPVPVVKDWIEPQLEYEVRRTQITGGAGRSARKVFYEEGTFTDEEEARKALQSPVDMEAVKVTSLQRRPQVQADSDLNGSIYRDVLFLQGDWRVITGQTGARMSDPDRETATEAGFAERAANLRDSDLQRSVVRWLAQAGKKMLQCVAETLTLRLWIQMREASDKEFLQYAGRVYGLQPEAVTALPGLKEAFKQRFGAQRWISITREDLIFEAEVTVSPGSTRPKSLDAERRAWLDFLRILGAAPQLALSRALLDYTAAKFEIEDDRLLDELTALAEKMVGINANQAGRTQGGGQNPGAGGVGGSNGNVTDANSAILAAVTGGQR